jgi:hypothetical protein
LMLQGTAEEHGDLPVRTLRLEQVERVDILATG